MTFKEKKEKRSAEKYEKLKERKRLKRLRKKERKRLKALWLKSQNKNEHHIFPKSLGGKKNRQNIAYVDINKHCNYHILFKNKSPDEIINYLIDYFWNGQTKWVFEAIANRKGEE